MNAPLNALANTRAGMKLDKRAFLQWVQTQERRCELKNDEVIMHPGVSRDHAVLVGRFVIGLGSRLDPDAWNVSPADFAVEVGPDIRYPDVLVERVHLDGAALSTDAPIVLVEVLSPSSVGTDMVEKLAEYTSLPSLEAYLVASQEAPICWMWQRGGVSREFPKTPQEIAGRDKVIEIAALGVSLPMAEVYRGVGTG